VVKTCFESVDRARCGEISRDAGFAVLAQRFNRRYGCGHALLLVEIGGRMRLFARLYSSEWLLNIGNVSSSLGK
jgi:hypothetical protein